MLKDRVYIHKFLGGSASYVFAQRLNADTPGLLIYPARSELAAGPARPGRLLDADG